MKGITVRLARPSDRDALARMRHVLWPASSAAEHAQELELIVAGKRIGTMPLVIHVAEAADGTLAGFLEVGLRSYSDGCDPARPVGYVEGWYVTGSCRRRGIGAELLRAAENWARGQGCTEMASDSAISNRVSQRAHAALGFEVVERSVIYRKAL